MWHRRKTHHYLMKTIIKTSPTTLFPNSHLRRMRTCLAITLVTSCVCSSSNAEPGKDPMPLGDFQVKNPEILRISKELLQKKDEDLHNMVMPNPHKDAQWFPQAGLGLFMHWGIHSVVGAQPSWSMIKDYPHRGAVNLYPPKKYFSLAEKFNPKQWNPDKWLGDAKDAGFTYAVLTAKHHDGYALWPSDYGYFSTRQYLDGRDLVKPYVEACRKHGLKVGLYFSPRDWRYPNYPLADVDFDFKKRGKYHPVDPETNRKRFEQFFAFTIGQLHELLTQYGKIDILWFDGMEWNGIDDMHTQAVYDWIRSLQPGIVINERWSKVRNPDAANKMHGFGDFVTVECRHAEQRPASWWETCNLWDSGGGWGYDKGERIKSLEWTLENLIRCRRWGGNYLPNVGVRPDGEMTRGYYERCKELQKWMDKHRDSVIGTSALADDSIVNAPVTCRPGMWYVHVRPQWNRSTKIEVKSMQEIESVRVMRSGKKLAYKVNGGKLLIVPPQGSVREVVMIKFKSAK